MNIAVILAAGTSSRFKLDGQKQLMTLAGRTVLETTAESFIKNIDIDALVIVTNQDIQAEANRIKSKLAQHQKPIQTINGGHTRQDSSAAAIKATEHLTKQYRVHLIFHDAVRPLVAQETISDVVRALNNYAAVDVAIPATDTIIRSHDGEVIADIPSRSQMYLGQTPQGFRWDTIYKAYEIAQKDPSFVATDDCGVVNKYLPHVPIAIIKGTTDNLKLTYAEDLHVIDRLMQVRSKQANHMMPEAEHFAGKSVMVVGGTSGIGLEIARLCRVFGASVEVYSRRTGHDIRNYNHVLRMMDHMLDNHRKLDYLINCSGILAYGRLDDLSTDELDAMVACNLTGNMYLSKAARPHLASTKGHLLTFASSSYSYGRANTAAYSATKAAVVNLTQALAEEWGAEGIRVNCVSPRRTRTPMRTSAFGHEPIETLLDPVEVGLRTLAILQLQSSGQVWDIN